MKNTIGQRISVGNVIGGNKQGNIPLSCYTATKSWSNTMYVIYAYCPDKRKHVYVLGSLFGYWRSLPFVSEEQAINASYWLIPGTFE